MTMSLPRLEKKWTIHLIHHTHTDIGYTDHQGKIERFQIDYLKQAISIFEKAASGERDDWKGFRWTAETFWAVERFLAATDAGWHERLANAIRGGGIELTATYLHWNELISQGLSQAFVARATDYGKKIGVPVRCALSADINGYGWGYADSLLNNGVENFMVCIHSHHGMPPLGKRQVPFKWKAPSGGELLVWSGDHYMMGNFLGLVPRAAYDMCFRDEFTVFPLIEENMPVATARLGRYLAQLEADAYPYDFLPIGFSGIMVDNAPPNPEMCAFVREWNARFGEQVQIEFSTPSRFFGQLRSTREEIPVHAGDWPDWWSDGLGSVPTETRLYRKSERDLRELEGALERYPVTLRPGTLESIRQPLALYAEHTFSHNDSLIYPWKTEVQAVSANKRALAQAAYARAAEAWDQIFVQKGHGVHENRFPMRFKVINPTDQPLTRLVEFYFDYFQVGQIDKGARVVDESTGQVVAAQMTTTRRGVTWWVEASVEPGEEKTYCVHAEPKALRYIERNPVDVAKPDVRGSEPASPFQLREGEFVSPHAVLRWSLPEGITELIDRKTNVNLLACSGEHTLFGPVYIKGLVDDPSDEMQVFRQRNAMGRNRNPVRSERDAGQLESVRLLGEGDLFADLELSFRVAGCEFYKVILRFPANDARIEAGVRLHKKSVWEVENLYVGLPFAKEGSALWLEKSGAWMRPYVDQIPDTLTDYYCLQDGFVVTGPDLGMAVACIDAPLLQLGPLEHGIRKLAGHPDLRNDVPKLYSWVMNNIWEVNFDPNLGGFHEFCYAISWSTQLRDLNQATRKCRILCEQLKAFQVPGIDSAMSNVST